MLSIFEKGKAEKQIWLGKIYNFLLGRDSILSNNKRLYVCVCVSSYLCVHVYVWESVLYFCGLNVGERVRIESLFDKPNHFNKNVASRKLCTIPTPDFFRFVDVYCYVFFFIYHIIITILEILFFLIII